MMSSYPDPVHDYIERLIGLSDLDAVSKQLIIATLFRFGPMPEASLIPKLAGRNPSHIRSYLSELQEHSICQSDTSLNRTTVWAMTDAGNNSCIKHGLLTQAEWLQRLAEAQQFVENDVLSHLPPPHVRNYEWRFSSDGLKTLADHIYSDMPFACLDTIAALNTPLFAFFAWKLGITKRIRLYDRNIRLLALAQQLGDRLEPIHFEAREIEHLPVTPDHRIVVMDPPWFPEYYSRYIAQLPRFIRPPAQVYALLQPQLTLAPSLSERATIIAYFLEQRLVPVGYYPSRIGYVVNAFEKSTFGAEGIHLDKEWNYGDLLCLRTFEPTTDPLTSALVSDSEWDDYYLPTQVISIKKSSGDQENACDPLKIALASPDAIFSSISGKEHVLHDFQIWTSRNRIYQVNRIRPWHTICKALEQGSLTYHGALAQLIGEGMSLDGAESALAQLCAPGDFA